MQRLVRILALTGGLWLPAGAAIAGTPSAEIAVIASPGIAAVDQATLQRLYTGRGIAVGDVPVTVTNARPGTELRERFLELVMRDTEARYTAYWIVRRHVGKGVPPPEFASSRDAIDYVKRTPGAIAYVPAAEVPAGTNVIFKAP